MKAWHNVFFNFEPINKVKWWKVQNMVLFKFQKFYFKCNLGNCANLVLKCTPFQEWIVDPLKKEMIHFCLALILYVCIGNTHQSIRISMLPIIFGLKGTDINDMISCVT